MIRTSTVGKSTLRLVQTEKDYVGVIFAADGARKLQIHGNDAEELWKKLNEEVAKTSPDYFGFDGARSRFLHFFPNGFKSTGYQERERNYKVAAKARLDSAAPLKMAGESVGLGDAVLRIFQATNLLSPFEKTRLQNVLRGTTADPFVHAAAEFTDNPSSHTLRQLDLILRPHDSAKWTVVTYLPFLWKPEAHMFLKPTVTKDYAERVGHSFAQTYEANLNFDVYRSLLDLADETMRETSELKPIDRIDIQSFIWTVGAYKLGREEPRP